jgi:hypothetical protein
MAAVNAAAILLRGWQKLLQVFEVVTILLAGEAGTVLSRQPQFSYRIHELTPSVVAIAVSMLTII